MKFLGIDLDGQKANLSILNKKGKVLDFKNIGFSDVKLFYKKNLVTVKKGLHAF